MRCSKSSATRRVMSRRRPRSVPMAREARLKFALVLASAAASLVVAELDVRAGDAVAGRGFFSGARNELAHEKPVIPFLTFGFPLYKDVGDRRYVASRHGELYPFDKPEGTTRIVAFGGSTTENAEVMKAHGTHYPKELERMLRSRLGRTSVEVINVGNSAYATPHALILLSLHVLSRTPDVVVLGEHVNDLMASYFPKFRVDYSNKYSNPFFGMPNAGEHASLVNRLFQRSELYWVLRN